MSTVDIKTVPDLNTPSQELQIIVIHAIKSNDPSRKRLIRVDIRTNADSGQRITRIDNLELEETKPDSGVFAGSIHLTPDRKLFSGDLEVLPGDLITISYDRTQLEPSARNEVIVTETIEVVSFDPEFILDKDLYNIGDKVMVTMSDPGANFRANSEDLVNFKLYSDSDPDGIAIEGKETGNDTGVFTCGFRLASETKKDSIRAGVGDTVTIAYTSEFPADYRERVENKEDPRKTFFFSFDVGIPLEDDKVLERLKGYFDPRIYDKIRRGAFLPTTNKIITIVFWDIRGFSRMCEILRAKPKMAVEFLQEYSDLATEVVAQFDGILDKFIGDGVMALFGVYERADRLEPAIAAANAALAFREGFLKLVGKWKPIWSAAEEQEIVVELGCGINTGEAIVGSMGKARQQFTAVGRSVNIASRLEARSKENKILVTSTTKEKVDEVFKTVFVGKIEDMKNIQGTYPYYEVVSEINK